MSYRVTRIANIYQMNNERGRYSQFEFETLEEAKAVAATLRYEGSGSCIGHRTIISGPNGIIEDRTG